ncbi:MAG: Uma2 family endonuclease [Acidobacteriota bacterium]|nr:Uma2 family endonuclease [Acidobacteriota bacterium]
MPSLKHAELIQGRVYLPSPVSDPHCSMHFMLSSWTANYVRLTPGCGGKLEGTWLMLDDVPQPDIAVVILPEYRGQSRVMKSYNAGAPELAIEICLSSKSRDLGPKLELYREAGVREYLTVMLPDSSLTWRYLAAGQYIALEPDTAGVLRSQIFPGLWLDVRAVFTNDSARLWNTLEHGLNTAEHERFVRELAARASGT